MKASKVDILLICLLLLFLPLFFFKLGQTSLTSFDEAWYGAIAKNIIATGNPLYLSFNGSPYTDHPPAGFLLMAIAMKLFGATEFAVRFVSGAVGFLSLITLYLLGKELFNRTVGFTSAIALSSSYWFLFRARSGNLDIILTFFFILSIYLGVKASKNYKYLWPFSISLIFLFLSKSIIPFTILPTLIIIFWNTDKKILREIIQPIILICIFVGGWFLAHILKYPAFISHYLKIGLPGIGQKSSLSENFALTKEYLHNGIGKWFWPGVFSSLVGILLRKKSFLILGIFFISFTAPFLLSQKGHIWHLIPAHPFMILAFFGFAYTVLKKLSGKIVASLGILLVCFYFSFIQIRRMWYEFIAVPSYTSDEAILSESSKAYPGSLYVDGDFLPAAVYYSDKTVYQIHGKEISSLLSKNEPLTIIATQNQIDAEDIDSSKYEIIKSDRDKLLIKPKEL